MPFTTWPKASVTRKKYTPFTRRLRRPTGAAIRAGMAADSGSASQNGQCACLVSNAVVIAPMNMKPA